MLFCSCCSSCVWLMKLTPWIWNFHLFEMKIFYFPFFSIFRGSVQPVAMGDTTVTPTLPALWTQRTSDASSMTVETSSSGCTCGSTSYCDERSMTFGQKTLGLRKTLTPESESLTPPFHRSVWRTRSQNALTRKHTLNPELGLMQTSYLQ